MLLDRFGKMLSSNSSLMRKAASGPLLRVGSALAGASPCCCDAEPVPTSCTGAVGVAGCFSDLLAAYPTNPTNNAAMYAYISGFQFDIDFSGTFTFPCSAPTCDDIAATFTVSYAGVTSWSYSENCTDGAINYNWGFSLSWFCGSPLSAGTCAWDINGSSTKISGSPTWGRGYLWRLPFTDRKVFATTSENIPFAAQTTTFGTPGCTYSGGDASVVVH
jgi:hypothetical protein